MAVHKIKKGLNLPIEGEPRQAVEDFFTGKFLDDIVAKRGTDR